MVKLDMQKLLKLNNGCIMPVLGLGTWESPPHAAGNAVEYAIKNAGYRHIDCAAIYGNEKEIGKVFKNLIGTVVKREELFVTSKLWNTMHAAEHVEKACKQTLKDLQLEYLDLYLIHWGLPFKYGDELEPVKDGKVLLENVSTQETWQAMEDLVKNGLVKSIGIANFTTTMIVDLLTYAKIKPVINQIEVHPYNSQTELIQYCADNRITVTAYSPLGRPGANGVTGPKIIDEPVVKKLAQKYKKTPAQIILRWGVQRNTVVIPKSVTPERISENADIFDFELSTKEMQSINSLNKNFRFLDPLEWWGVPYFK
jgi:diketogulonate reductase-like aldo/keto reductase